jgi:uncharacterized SAM-binding protein YcdF (DUF218 family)
VLRKLVRSLAQVSLGSSLPRVFSLVLSIVSLGCAGGCARNPQPTAAPASHEAAVADAIVVLGHRPPLVAGQLEYETRARVEQGIALFKQGRAKRLVFSGGPSTPEAIEADVMAAYAASRGVPEDALLRERRSRDTIENARLSVELLRRELTLLLATARRPRVVLVTSDYHIERATKLFRCAGAEVEAVSVPLELSRRERRKKRWSERFVRLYYLFIDECGRAVGT